MNAIMDGNGNLIDEHGNRIDWDGNRIDEDGFLLDSSGNYVRDDYGDYVQSKALEHKSAEEVGDGISNTSVPAPLEEDYDPYEGNNMESEGITNEEAGYE